MLKPAFQTRGTSKRKLSLKDNSPIPQEAQKNHHYFYTPSIKAYLEQSSGLKRILLHIQKRQIFMILPCYWTSCIIFKQLIIQKVFKWIT